MLKRFYISNLTKDNKVAQIAGKEYHHLKNVLRMKVDDSIVVFNGKGIKQEAIIKEITKDNVLIEINATLPTLPESPLNITLVQALTKGTKPELIVEKATELGVKKILFFTTARTSPPGSDEKITKLRYTALMTLKQCQRDIAPTIHGVFDYGHILQRKAEDIKLIFSPTGISIKKSLHNNLKDVTIMIGPEGGFTSEEISQALNAGYKEVVFGPRILRHDTASIAAISVLQTLFGDMASV